MISLVYIIAVLSRALKKKKKVQHAAIFASELVKKISQEMHVDVGPHRDPTGKPTGTAQEPHRDHTGTPQGPHRDHTGTARVAV